jgi:hypothetical protein
MLVPIMYDAPPNQTHCSTTMSDLQAQTHDDRKGKIMEIKDNGSALAVGAISILAAVGVFVVQNGEARGSRLLLTGPPTPTPSPYECSRFRQIRLRLGRKDINDKDRAELEGEYASLTSKYGAQIFLQC